jgi:hypothetical protein
MHRHRPVDADAAKLVGLALGWTHGGATARLKLSDTPAP